MTNTTDPSGLEPPYSVMDQRLRIGRYYNWRKVTFLDSEGVVVFSSNDTVSWMVSDLRRTYGGGITVYENVSSLQEMVDLIKRHPEGSIRRLVIAGHNRGAGCGVAVLDGINVGLIPRVGLPRVLPDERRLPLHISARSIVGKNAEVIRSRLAKGAVVELRSCVAGNRPESMRFLANNLQATVRAATGDVGPGGRVEGGTWREVPFDGPPEDHPADRR